MDKQTKDSLVRLVRHLTGQRNLLRGALNDPQYPDVVKAAVTERLKTVELRRFQISINLLNHGYDIEGQKASA